MNCREAENQIFAERDGALDPAQRAALDRHVAGCAHCRAVRDHFAAAIESWRGATLNVAVPDAEREWQALRRRIRGGVQPGAEPTVDRRPNVLRWLALPLAAAAALVITLWTPEKPAGGTVAPERTVARANASSVEVSAADGAVVYVDEKSGWVVVWSEQPAPTPL